MLAARLAAARERLDAARPRPRPAAPRVEAVYELLPRAQRPTSPTSCVSSPARRRRCARPSAAALALLNKASGGALLTASADLLGSTSVSADRGGLRPRLLERRAPTPRRGCSSIGGICEDAIAGVLSGISAYGHAIGVGSSYGAFMAPLGHIAARLHAIGAQARQAASAASLTGR